MSLGPRYHRLFSASVISNLGDGVFMVALPLIAADLTRDPKAIAFVAVTMRLPWLLFALVAGALVDRLDRRAVMWITDLGRAILVGGLALAVATDTHSMPMLYAIGFVLGLAETMFDNASQTILPSIVADGDDLPRANGRLFAAEQVTNSFIGPPLGGLLVAAAAAAPFWLDAASFLAAALLVASIPGRFHPEGIGTATGAASPSLRREIAEGIRWLLGSPLLRTLALLLGLMNLWWAAGMAVMVLFAQDLLGVGAVGFGLLMAATAIGAIVAGLVAGRLAERHGRAPMLRFGAFGIAATQLLIAPLSNAWIAATVLALSGFVGVTWNVVTVSLRQTIIPDQLLGRVNSVYRFLGWGGMPVGAVVGGVLADAFGLRAPFLAGGVVLLAAALLAAPHFTETNIRVAMGELDPLPT